MSSGSLLAGFVLIIGGLIYGASVATNWPAVGAIVFAGFALVTGVGIIRARVLRIGF